MMDEKLIERLCRFVSERAGLRIRSQDTPQFMSAVNARIRHLCLNSPEEYQDILNTRPVELLSLKRMLAVNETYFFRDKGQFELLRRAIIPELIEGRSAKKKLCIWSAGCSTGEEPYSLAILIDQMLPRAAWEINILGTDMQAEHLEKARAGLYGEWSFRSVDKDLVARYFKRKKNLYELSAEVRGMVKLAEHDLMQDEAPDFGLSSGADLILCRNVFIYYNEEAVASICKKLARCLNEGGYLMTGHGELYGIDISPLKPVSFPESLVYRKPLADEAVKTHELNVVKRPAVSAHCPIPRRDIVPPAAARAQVRAKPAPSSDDEGANIEGVIREAEGLFRKGEYREAIARLEPALLKTPGNVSGLNMMARACANIGDYERALGYINKAKKEDPLGVEPYFLLAELAESGGNAEEAKGLLKRVIYLDPSSVPAYLELASIYEKEGDAGRAKKLRYAALDVLKTFPVERPVERYEGMTAGELAAYVKKMVEG